MSIRTIARSSSNRNSASARASSVFPTPVGPRKMNEPIGRFGSDRPARERRMAFATALDGLVLADDPRVQRVLQVDELLHLALHQPRHRDAGPLRDDLGDVLLVDLLLQHLPVGLELGERLVLLLQPLLELDEPAVPDLGRPLEVAVALGRARLSATRPRSRTSARGSRRCARFSCCQCAFIPALRSCRSASSRSSFSSRSLRRVVGLLLQRRALDLELLDAALDLVDLDRHRVDLDPQAAGRPRRSGRSPCPAGTGR